MFTNNPRIVTDGIVGAWDALMPNTATAATKLYDAAGSTDGTMYNGTCLDFDGSDDSVDVPDNSDLDGFSKFTLSGWVNPNVTGGYRVIFDQYYPSGYTWRISNIDYPYIYVNGNYLIASATVTEGAWNHLVVTYDGTSTSNNVNFYMAGELVSTGTLNEGTVGTSSYGLKIGVDHAGVTSPMDGKLADLRIYDVILSAANVKELYDDSKVIIPTKNDASGGFVAQTNLKGWWPLAEGAGIIAYDGSGNGNEGILTNMDPGTDWLTDQTGCPQLVEGYNRPMLFDGSNDYVQVASDGSSTFANQSYTVAGWIQIGDLTSDKGIFSYDFTSHVSPYYATHVRVTANELYLLWNDGSSYQYISKTSAFTVNTWHHYACTFTSGSQKIYIDGAEVASGTRADTITYYNQEVWIGKNNYSTSFNSLMNETVVYNSALTLAQVQVLAATGPNGGPLPPDPMSLSNSSNVVGYWRNDGNVTWKDRSGNGNDGTVYGSPDNLLFKQGINGSASTSTGRDGQGFPLKQKNVGAVGFNGSDNYVDLYSDVTFKASGGWTVESWVMPDAASAGPYNIIGSTTYDYNSWFWSLFSNKLALWDLSPGNVWKYGNTSLLVGQWYHTVLVSDPDNTSYYIYLNGEDDMSTAWAAYNGSWQPSKAGLKVRYFGRGNTASGRYWNGQLSGAKFYDRALTQAEITQNFNAQRSRFGV